MYKFIWNIHSCNFSLFTRFNESRWYYWFQFNCWNLYFLFIHTVLLSPSIWALLSFNYTIIITSRNMSNNIAHVHYWLVRFLALIGVKNVMLCSCFTYANIVFNPLSQKIFIPFVKLYIWENIWLHTVISSVVYSIVSSFASTVCVIKLLVW